MIIFVDLGVETVNQFENQFSPQNLKIIICQQKQFTH